MKIMKLQNEMIIEHLMRIIDNNWNEYYIDHPERGKENLEKLIDRRINHINEHLKYINRNRDLFGKK
jgi:hypothetical protein